MIDHFFLEIYLDGEHCRNMEVEDFDSSMTDGLIFQGKCDVDFDGSLRFFDYNQALMLAKEFIEEHVAIGLPRPDVHVTIVQGEDIVDTIELCDDRLEEDLIPPQQAL